MNHLKAIGIKMIFTTIILLSLLPIFGGATIPEILLISLLVTGMAYVIGDLFILPRFGNFIATIADFGLAFLSIWLLSSIFITTANPIITVSGFTAFFVAISEGLFHIYMKERVLIKKKDGHYYRSHGLLTTEFAEDETIDRENNEKKERKK